MAKKNEEVKPTRGGVREGSGRKAIYGEPLTAIVAIALDDAQSAAIVAYAKRHKLSVSFLLREAALEAAGASRLGIGFDSGAEVAGWAEPREVVKWPVKFTAKQHDAITRAAERIGVTQRVFVLEAALSKVGKPRLGERGELADRLRRLEKIG